MRLISLIFIACFCLTGCHKNTTDTLTILHTNDLHSHFLPSDNQYQDCDINNPECLGGYARIKTIADTIRADNDDVLFLDAGDRFSGTVFYTMRKSTDLAKLTQKLNYDVITLGNHEFDDKTDELTRFLKTVSAPVVSANVRFPTSAELSDRVQPSVLLNKNGLKVGIIGALSEETAQETVHGRDIIIDNVIDAVRKEAKKLTQQGASILIALTHIGIEEDKQLASAVPELDIIVGAHTHTLLSNDPNEKKAYGPYPIVISHPDANKTLIVTAGLAGQHIGLLKTTFDNNGRIISHTGNALRVDASIKNDTDITQTIQKVQKILSDMTDTPIGQNPTEAYLTNKGTYCSENCYAGEVLTDMILSAAKNDRADIALLNAGGIRAALPAGALTLRHIAAAYPFDSDAVLVQMSGQELMEYISFGLKKYRPDDRTNAFLQIAGGSYQFCPKTKTVTKLTVAGKSVQYNKSYHVILSSFLADGGDGFMPQKPLKTYKISIRDMMIDSLKNGFHVKSFENRIQKEK